MPRTVVITGASSGIGRALACNYAAAGVVLHLAGRNAERLEAVAQECRRRGAVAVTKLVDVTDRDAMGGWLRTVQADRPIDLLIANAGVMAGTTPDGRIEDAAASYELVQVNVLGVLNTIQPTLPDMMSRRSGQIAIISSIAAFTPLADAPGYSASKAAVLNYGLSLRDFLAETGVKVSVICPGYVDTEMFAHENGTKPFVMPASEAAQRIARGLADNRAVIVFPFLFALITRIGGLLPDWLRRWTGRGFRFTVSPR